MKIFFSMILILLPGIVVAEESSHFAPGIVNRVPTKEEKTSSNRIKTKEECTNKGGKWFENKKYDFGYCVIPYPDAGKLCKTSKDCLGHCIWPLNQITLDGKPLDKGYGICQINDSTDDCGRPHFENGEIIYFNCD